MKLVGNQKRYQANRESPIYWELRMIVFKTLSPGARFADSLR